MNRGNPLPMPRTVPGALTYVGGQESDPGQDESQEEAGGGGKQAAGADEGLGPRVDFLVPPRSLCSQDNPNDAGHHSEYPKNQAEDKE